MALARNPSLFLFCIFVILSSGANARNFTLVNQCKETIWPAIITDGGNFHGEGFKLESGQTAFYNASDGWSGRIWGRTSCDFDKNGNGTCQTGSCGTSINCTNAGSMPVTIAEFTLGEIDYYDVSLVDGFNLPIVITPGGGKGNCSTAGCDGDLRQNCSSDLVVKNNGKVVGCRSACDAFNTDEHCCRGKYEDPVVCLPTNYSKSFKEVCPAASSFQNTSAIRVFAMICKAHRWVGAGCRNYTICTYHDQKLVCGTTTSEGFKAFSQGWRSLMLALALASILQILL